MAPFRYTVNFINDKQSMKDLGWKALAVNYSDIASMGCKPSHTLVTLGLRPNIEIADLEEISFDIRSK